MDQRYDINQPAVTSEVITGEAIMMHHPSADYCPSVLTQSHDVAEVR